MYLVGKVLKPRGLKGEVKVEVVTSFPEHFRELKTIIVEKNGQQQEHTINLVKQANRSIVLKLKDVNSIEQAEQLRNAELFIKQDQLTELEQDEYYIHDLIGLDVYDEQDNRIGELIDVESYTSNDVYKVKGADGKEYLIPATLEIIKKVSVSDKRMVIHVLEGLLD